MENLLAKTRYRFRVAAVTLNETSSFSNWSEILHTNCKCCWTLPWCTSAFFHTCACSYMYILLHSYVPSENWSSFAWFESWASKVNMENNILHNTWRANDASYLAYFYWYQNTSQCHATTISCCYILVADWLRGPTRYRAWTVHFKLVWQSWLLSW